MKRYPTYHSTGARISRRMGIMAVLVGALSILAHRTTMVSTDVMVYSVLLGTLLGLLALSFGLIAVGRLWIRGGTGASSAFFGVIYGLLALVPICAFASNAILFSSLTDISTDLDDPPQFVFSHGQPQALQIDLPSGFTRASEQVSQRDAFPDIVSRRYRIAPAELHAAALEVAERSGWKIVFELSPDLLDAPTALQVETETPILGLPEDMVVRIRPDAVGALLDVRSVSRLALQGLTGNAKRVRGFFSDMDDVLRETYGNVERLTVLEIELVEPDDDVDAAGESEVEGTDLKPTTPDATQIPLPGFKPFYEDDDELTVDEPNVSEQ